MIRDDLPPDSPPEVFPGKEGNRESHEEERLAQIVEVIIALASKDFSRRAPVGDGTHPFDGVATGLNMLAEEIGQQHHTEHEHRQRLARSDRLAAVGQLAASVAHEINNPAAFVLANLSALEDRLSNIESFIGEVRTSFPKGSPADRCVAELLARSGIDHGLGDARRSLADSVTGVQRIVSIVKELPEAAGLPRPSAPAPAPPPPVVAKAGRPRVLIVDDEEELLVAYERLLRRAFDLTLARSGRAALEILETDARWDAILCDIMMPDLDGTAVFEWVGDKRPELLDRLGFCTGGVFTPRSRALAERVAGRLFEKPMSRPDLVAAVEQLRGK